MMWGGPGSKAFAIASGAASFTIGAFQSVSNGLSGLDMLVGGSLLIALWVGHRVSTSANEYFKKLVDLPEPQELAADKKNLLSQLEKFAEAAHVEAQEMAKFRETLGRELSDHGARIKNLEGAIFNHQRHHSEDHSA